MVFDSGAAVDKKSGNTQNARARVMWLTIVTHIRDGHRGPCANKLSFASYSSTSSTGQ